MLQKNASLFWNIKYLALCAAAWLIVAEAYPCTEYSGSGTETVRPSALTKTQTPDNCKLSYVLEFMKWTCLTLVFSLHRWIINVIL